MRCNFEKLGLHGVSTHLILFDSGEDGGSSKLEGQVQRKHEWESSVTKASHRTWDKLYAVLSDQAIKFYKDQKHAQSVSSSI